ncbi:zinc finger BED domain-containing protein RICESLEEPER 2-like protein [Tanacetum coccineum]
MLKDVFKSGGRNYKHYIRICKEAEKPAYLPNWDVPTRWNSTYHKFQCGLKQEATLMYFHELLANKELLIETISTDLEFFDDGHATKTKKLFNDYLEGLYNIYYAKYGNPTTESRSGGSSSRASGGNQMTNLLNQLKDHKNKKTRSDSSLSSEYERYVHSDFITHLQYSEFTGFDVLGFWKPKESMFPVLSHMAMDLISVQATSVASKSAFLTSERVLSIRRTKLTPSSLHMCMCLKDHLDAQERKQHTSALENSLDFEDVIFDAEVQENEATPLSDEEIALDVASQGTMASGSGGEEQDFGFGFDLTNYGIDN